MKFPWTNSKKVEIERNLATVKAVAEKTRERRVAASQEIEKILDKLLEIKDATHGPD